MSGRTVGDFVIGDRIGQGGFGAVYRCEQQGLGRPAVIKILHQRLRHSEAVVRRFLREAKLASQLDHPYAAHIYAFGIESDGLFWIAMEMVHGATLARWLRDRGPLALDHLIPLFERIAEVVQCAHDAGIVHRDLKPSNVMVIERAGRLLPKLLDFGVAKFIGDAAAEPSRRGARRSHVADAAVTPTLASASASSSGRSLLDDITATAESGVQQITLDGWLTEGDAAVGSPPYMSPEQWQDPLTVGPRADLYSLAILAYEALGGRRPFFAGSNADYAILHAAADVPPLGAGFPPALDGFFRRALAKDPDERFASALELAAAFREAAGVARSPTDLPRLDDAVRVAWLADAPQPVAEAIASLDGAHNVHQARDAGRDVARTVVRYFMAIALAARSQVREGRDDEQLHELLRELRRRDLQDVERIRLVRHLVRPFIARRGAYPVSELVDLVTPQGDDGDALAGVADLLVSADPGTSEELVRGQLARLIAALGRLLRAATPMLAYSLAVPADGAVACWTGLRRRHRALAQVTGELLDRQPALVAGDGRVVLNAWPLIQCLAPSPGAELELFAFDGVGRRGARLVASPMGFEHHDPALWDWFERHAFGAAHEARELADESRPYMGLFPFRSADAARFFGREREIDGFINRLRSSALQIVVGPSGAGKTSFVHAGVLPALPPGWSAVALRPGVSPMASLAAALVVAGIISRDSRAAIETSPRAAAAHIARAAAGATLVIVVDQLEELFTLRPPAAEREQFAALLAELSTSAESATRVVCTVRDDFLMLVEALLPLRSLVMPAVFLLGNPSRDDLIRIVEEPARRAGYELSDPELAADMVAAVVDRPGALALLSFTASRLWELRDRRFRQLSRRAYDATGGVGGALCQHAETMLSALASEDQRLVRAAFRHLVTSEQTRAVLTLEELRQRMASERAAVVIDKLVSARLVTVREAPPCHRSEAHIELVHEALIAAWPRLQQWIREDAHGTRLHEQLRAAARQWQDRARATGLLWRGDALADLERWRGDRPVALSDVERAFADASRRETRVARRIRRTLVILALVALVSAGYVYRRLQNRGQELAEARVTQSYTEQGRHALLDGKHGEALAYLAAATRRGDGSPAVAFMLARATQPFLANRARLAATLGRSWSAMFSRDGHHLLTTDDKGARLWDARTYRLVAALPHDATVADGSFTPDGAKVVTAGMDGLVKVWDAATGKLQRALMSSALVRPAYERIGISPDGRLIAAIEQTGAVAHVWDGETGELIAELPNNPAWATALAFSADGRWLATSGGDDVAVFDTRTWTVVVRLPGPQIYDLAFDPTGARIAAASSLGDTSIWAIPTGVRIHHLQGSGVRISHVAYSRDGALLATASRDGSERIWDAPTGTLRHELKNHRGNIPWIEFDSTSRRVVSGGADGNVVISDVAIGAPVSVLEGPTGRVNVARFDPASERVVGASWDGVAWVWDAASSYQRWSSRRIAADCITDPRVDGDQRFLAVTCTEHGTHIWDTTNDQILAHLPSATEPDGDFMRALPAISAMGDRAAIAIGNTVAIYELPGGRLVRTISHPAAVTAMVFSRVGRDVVSGSSDGSLLLTPDGRDPIALPAFPVGVDALALGPDRRLIVAGPRGRLRVYDPDRRMVVVELESSIRIQALRLSADGERLLAVPASSPASAPVLWDLTRYRVTAQLESNLGSVYSARFVRGDRDILIASGDRSLRLWDGWTGRLRQRYFGNDQYLFDAVLDPDGSTIVGAGSDGVLRFWDAASGRMLWTLRGHRGAITGLHFDGGDLVSRGSEGEISRWTVPKQLSSDAIDRAVRCLPLRFDEDAGGLVEQTPACDLQ